MLWPDKAEGNKEMKMRMTMRPNARQACSMPEYGQGACGANAVETDSDGTGCRVGLGSDARDNDSSGFGRSTMNKEVMQ